jgi:hypothetical protein
MTALRILGAARVVALAPMVSGAASPSAAEQLTQVIATPGDFRAIVGVLALLLILAGGLLFAVFRSARADARAAAAAAASATKDALEAANERTDRMVAAFERNAETKAALTGSIQSQTLALSRISAVIDGRER